MSIFSKRHTVYLVSVFVLILSVFWFFFSFTQTDPNLLYINSTWFDQFQNIMWGLGQNRTTLVIFYALFVGICFVLYGQILKLLEKKQTTSPFVTISLIIAGVLLLLANPALSHDLFNYLFNAKAVLVYGKDPHLLSALQVAPQDEWVRFMHNVHTPAPYGYVWTALSLLPFVAGFGKFIVTFLSFKIWMGIGLAVLIWLQVQLSKARNQQMHITDYALFVANPLVLIETLGNGHNDVWMIVGAFASFVILLRNKKPNAFVLVGSFLLLLLSSQIKIATILLVPIWIALVQTKLQFSIPKELQKLITRITDNFAEISAFLLFMPLITERSQQFHPWYLLWSLSFLPFMKNKMVRLLFISFSLTSMLRYIPFLLHGGYSEEILSQSKVITWSAPLVFLIFIVLYHFLYRVRYNKNA